MVRVAGQSQLIGVKYTQQACCLCLLYVCVCVSQLNRTGLILLHMFQVSIKTQSIMVDLIDLHSWSKFITLSVPPFSPHHAVLHYHTSDYFTLTCSSYFASVESVAVKTGCKTNEGHLKMESLLSCLLWQSNLSPYL